MHWLIDHTKFLIPILVQSMQCSCRLCPSLPALSDNFQPTLLIYDPKNARHDWLLPCRHRNKWNCYHGEPFADGYQIAHSVNENDCNAKKDGNLWPSVTKAILPPIWVERGVSSTLTIVGKRRGNTANGNS